MSNTHNVSTYRGSVVYIFAYDLAYDMKRERLTSLLGRPVGEYSIGQSKRIPKQLFFYSPQMITLAPQTVRIRGIDVELERTVKIFNIGAVSIQVRVPFVVEDTSELVGYHELYLEDNALKQEVYHLARQVLSELEPYCIKPVSQITRGEEYTVFCIDRLLTDQNNPVSMEKWLVQNRRRVAALLTEEEDVEGLSDQEAAESTQQYLSYYDSDLVVVDWDAALVIGEENSRDDILHIMELANVQLLELAAYDRILDGSLETAYRDVNRSTFGPKREILRNIREIRVDLARLSDELINTSKFFGDWHLARIYQNLSNRFHLADWNKIIGQKLDTLGGLYHLLEQDWVNFRMIVLEVTIVLLFVIDLLLLIIR